MISLVKYFKSTQDDPFNKDKRFQFNANNVLLISIFHPGYWFLYCIYSAVYCTAFNSLGPIQSNTVLYEGETVADILISYLKEYKNFILINVKYINALYKVIQPDKTACEYYTCACANLILQGGIILNQ